MTSNFSGTVFLQTISRVNFIQLWPLLSKTYDNHETKSAVSLGIWLWHPTTNIEFCMISSSFGNNIISDFTKLCTFTYTTSWSVCVTTSTSLWPLSAALSRTVATSYIYSNIYRSGSLNSCCNCQLVVYNCCPQQPIYWQPFKLYYYLFLSINSYWHDFIVT